MTFLKKAGVCFFVSALAACSQADVNTATGAATETAKAVVSEVNPTEAFSQAPAGVYTVEKTHAYIAFSYDHGGFSKPILRWGGWDATLNWNPTEPESSSVSVTIPADTIDSGVPVFNDHLKSGDFFDTETFPEITFKSTKLDHTGGLKGQMTGDLTMKGVTKPVTLDVTFNKGGQMRGKTKLGFSAQGHLNRSDWGLGKYAPGVSDKVKIRVEAEFDKTE